MSNIDKARALALSMWMTPPALAERIVAWAKPTGYVLEPSCGTGNIAAACRAAGCDVTTVDLEPTFRPDIARDYREAKFTEQFDWIISNPPYEDNLDLDFMEKAAADARDVVMLVRVNALCGQKRYERLWKHVTITGVVYLVNRPSFALIDEDTGTPRHDFVVVRYTMEPGRVVEPVQHWIGNW